MIVGLKTVLPASQGRWRSARQHSLVAHVLEGIRDVLAVLPTGTGKSLSFLIPSVVQEKSIIVIVPLVALKHDLARRLTEMGCSFAMWSPRMVPAGAPKVVLVSIESINSLEYVTFVRSLQILDKLLCVIVDEVHLLLQNFRSGQHHN